MEFALVLPILLVILLGILDFGLYYYNDLQLNHAARDAARYLSVDKQSDARAAIDRARSNLVSTTIDSEVLDSGTSGGKATVTLEAHYTFLTPLPNLLPDIGGGTIGIDASATMRRE